MSGLILRIAVPSPLYRTFDYLPPPGCDPAALQPGMRVRVPFGRRQVIGFLVELGTDTPLDIASLRPALAILDTEPVLPADVLVLIQWAQRYYHHPLGEVFTTALPVLLRQGEPAAHPAPAPVWRITAAGHTAFADSASLLRRAPAQWRLLDYLAHCPDGAEPETLRPVVSNSTAVLRALRDKGWAEQNAAPKVSSSAPHFSQPPPVLTLAQTEAIAAITSALDRFQVFLLEGVTGSGKTEVYLQVIEAVLAHGRQALVLTPEIGLTPQLLARFRERLPGPLAVSHSGLSDAERLNAWLLAREGRARVVVGTRSAVFAPLQAPGILIIDEEHDLSFKQQDGFRYHARDLAVIRGQQLGIPVVLGSATPALESCHNAQRCRYDLLLLPERAGGGSKPPIQILDVRRQPMREGLSQPLLERIHAHLDRNEQVLLFLNRRGFAPMLLCHECGWLSQCRHCDARMTLHLRSQRLICHHCGDQRPVDSVCPLCGSVDLRGFGQGTERLEIALRQEFPETGIARMDRDSTRRRGSLETLLAEIQAGGRRLLIGTQMLAKGHHFPDVTLVGIIDADQGLYGIDFRASERMAQLILQVAGRAGRAEKPGTVIIQTHHPNHPLLRTLVSRGYTAFAAEALAERQAALLPPFAYQALLRAEAVDPERATGFLQMALALAGPLADGLELLGPAPAPMERRAGRYRAHLLIQAMQRQVLHRFLDRWTTLLWAERTDRQVRWSLDIDPVELY
ncbi:MAG TPA: primosomal protein N' [Candidatus Competibacteraceae bacterium]|nr:primosomal protein N' [Candidatus Competibacteraceae bacterium]MCP5132212.1 primosomal protein N' [Gammaproteobacteria bacterium]HPF59429.1 primosomal protein N' [Candidatus Competibacteraceae bacterium]HRY18309.1 primosomal protein N' [Candidatus Competibacteraceae bacterium]